MHDKKNLSEPAKRILLNGEQCLAEARVKWMKLLADQPGGLSLVRGLVKECDCLNCKALSIGVSRMVSWADESEGCHEAMLTNLIVDQTCETILVELNNLTSQRAVSAAALGFSPTNTALVIGHSLIKVRIAELLLHSELDLVAGFN